MPSDYEEGVQALKKGLLPKKMTSATEAKTAKGSTLTGQNKIDYDNAMEAVNLDIIKSQAKVLQYFWVITHREKVLRSVPRGGQSNATTRKETVP